MKTNAFSNPEENQASFLKRLFLYQNERFPLLGHGLLIASFSFSAIAYSRICRGGAGFVSWKTYLLGIAITVSLFLLVRIFDEFKDADEDARYRPHLPVPRGLIRFQELKILAIVTVICQVGINVFFFPKMLLIYLGIMAYLLLMGKEFFVAEWLKKRPFWYVTSHMFIIPLVDIYASGLDWLLEGVSAPVGLLFFFAVSYMNGIVLEVGRKIRTPQDESEGVQTYTGMLGTQKAVWLWLAVLTATFCLSLAAAGYAGYGTWALVILGTIFVGSSIPALLFLSHSTTKRAKAIELTSAAWTIAMYLSLGGIPMLQTLLFGR